jgi:hypothetical protein
MNKYLDQLSGAFTLCEPATKAGRISLVFNQQAPPEKPGVYVIYERNGNHPMYVGESGNLLQRLTYLFRCNAAENPHPFHRNHKKIYGEFPTYEEFCHLYSVRWICTEGAIGRLEIEDELKKQHGTNNHDFYANFSQLKSQFPPPIVIQKNTCYSCGEKNDDCAVWAILSGSNTYHAPIVTRPMGGRGADIIFQYEPEKSKVHVWRTTGLDFAFDADLCKKICQRYSQGLNESKLPPVYEDGGTAYFCDSHWPTPPLGRIITPYAAAVIRHVRRLHPGLCCPKT